MIARAPRGEGHVLVTDLDLDAVPRSHARHLFFRDRRLELYGDWLARGGLR